MYMYVLKLKRSHLQMNHGQTHYSHRSNHNSYVVLEDRKVSL